MSNSCCHQIPGWNSYPEYTMVCEDCEEEFVISGPQEEIDIVVCTSCSSSHITFRYMSFPTDGPGFQEGYNPEGLMYGGGAAVGDGNETDIAGLPLKVKVKRHKPKAEE